MSLSVTGALIRKDLRMTWPFLAAAFLSGGAALALWQLGSQAIAIAGIVGFFIVLVMLGILPMVTTINERKKQTLAFIMSLPLTATQYAIAKLGWALGMFLVPWLMLAGAALTLIVSRSDIPNGIIPLALILMLIPLVGFLIMISVAIVSESETKSVFTMGAINVSYSFVWVVISMTPSLTDDLLSTTPVWNQTVLSVLGGELGLIVAVLALTLYAQSRKRDFV